MAKSYIKGSSYKLYLNTGTYASPTWTEIKAVGDITLDRAPDDIEVQERGMDTGHLMGEANATIGFTLFEDAGDANVEALVAATYSGAMKELAVANGPIAASGTKYLRMECVLMGSLSAARSDVSSYEITAMRHANSDYAMTRTIVS